jgi:hypothetical protein
MASVYPEPDRFAAVFEELAALAPDVRVIATTTDGPHLGLVVPDDLHDRWVQSQEPGAPKKRGPGRPRKEQS